MLISHRRSLPNVAHVMKDIQGKDKIQTLHQVAAQFEQKHNRTMIFCNTIGSCRALEHAINEYGDVQALCYHGDMNSKERADNLEKFRDGEYFAVFCSARYAAQARCGTWCARTWRREASTSPRSTTC